MATLTFNGESFTVDHAVKGADYIHGYDADGVLIVAFDGITDFSRYSYDGTYMNPSDCLAEQCNEMSYCGGVVKTKSGVAVPPSAIGAAPAIESADHPGCYYRMVGNEKEWLNPPMAGGVEYRTTERYLGEPVYVFLYDLGGANPSGSVAHGLSVKRTISISLINGVEDVTRSSGINGLGFNTTTVFWDADWPMGAAKFTLKYNK